VPKGSIDQIATKRVEQAARSIYAGLRGRSPNLPPVAASGFATGGWVDPHECKQISRAAISIKANGL